MNLILATDTNFWYEDHGSRARIATLYRHLNAAGRRVTVYYLRSLTPEDRKLLDGQFPGHCVITAPPEPGSSAPVTTRAAPTMQTPGPLKRLPGRSRAVSANSRNLAATGSDEIEYRRAPTASYIPVRPRDKRLEDFVSQRHIERFAELCAEERPQALFFEFIRLTYLLDALDGLSIPRPKTFIDTIDFMSLRTQRFHQQNQPHWIDISENEERRALDRVDYVIAIQSRDAEVFRQMRPGKPVLTVGHPIPIQQHTKREHRHVNVAYLASGGIPNRNAIEAFLDRMWPTVHRQSPERARLLIAGAICDVIGESTAPPGAELLGYLDDLGDFYDHIDIVVNPVTFGGGLKIKCVEALCHGKPLVTTTIGTERIEEGAGSAYRVCDSDDAMITTLTELIDAPVLRTDLANSAADFAAAHFSRNAVYAELDRALEAIDED